MRQEAEAYIKLMDEKGVRHDDIVILESGKFVVFASLVQKRIASSTFLKFAMS